MEQMTHNVTRVNIETMESKIFVKEQEKKDIELEIAELRLEISKELREYYTAFEVSDRLEISINTVIKRIRGKHYSGLFIGGKWYAKKEDIENELYLAKRMARGI